jgi:hypothetical protein
MEIGHTEEQKELRARLRSYYAQLLDPDTVAELAHSRGIGASMRTVWKQMCADGWAGIGWPVEWSDEQKRFFLPKILAGDIHFCIGYSEPGAGTDLASLTTRAVHDGHEYVINGQRMWTSLAADADYCWLAVRTNPEVKKHQGISLIRTLITNQLNHERVTLCASGVPERALCRGARVGAGGTAPGRLRDRPRMGASQPRAGARPRRGAAPHELAGRLGGDPRRAGHRPLLVGEGVRHRVEPRSVAVAHGGALYRYSCSRSSSSCRWDPPRRRCCDWVRCSPTRR